MSTGATPFQIDVAQAVLYAFWVFFAGLIYYLQREMKREGYPLVSDGRGGRVKIQGFPAIPEPKSYLMPDGSTRQVPRPVDETPLQAEPTHRYPGSPIVPLGNPLLAGVGPGAWSDRADVPDLCADRMARIQPLRVLPGQGVADGSPDPRGWEVLGADDLVGGTVVDLWVDRAEAMFRYLEVEVAAAAGGRGQRVLLPMPLARVAAREVNVASILADQFADVPLTARPDTVTLREEERIAAYYGAGTLYATPARAEPLI